MLTVIETDLFAMWAEKVWTDEEREAFVDWIATRPDAGDVVAGSGGCRKVRWTRAGIGRRGGTRVVYFLRSAKGEIVLLIVYAKAKFDTLPAEFLKTLKEKVDAKA